MDIVVKPHRNNAEGPIQLDSQAGSGRFRLGLRFVGGTGEGPHPSLPFLKKIL